MPSDRIITANAGLKEIEFQPSTIETVDFALFSYFNEHCNLHTNSNKGWRKVPVIWVGAERAFQVKHNKDLRDSGGMLVLPMMAVERLSIKRDPARKGMMPADLLNHGDVQGGAITIARRIRQDKTSVYRSAAQAKRWAGDAFGGDGQRPKQSADGKVVYETITMPMPSYVVVEYKLLVQTDFHQQMNEILQSLYSRTGNHKHFMIQHDNHRFEAFMDDFGYDSNLATLEEEDRTLKTEVTITVEAYLIGGGPNASRPKVAIRENAVHVALPRESIMIDGFPVPEIFVKFSSGSAIRTAARLVGQQITYGKVQSTSGGASDLSSVIAHADFIVQESVSGTLNGSNTSFTLGASPRDGTLTLILNGVIQSEGANNDYTLSGTTVTMNFAPESDDTFVASYIKA